jgi:hypothetical protein
MSDTLALQPPAENSAQARFVAAYVTSSEVCQTLGVTRTSVLAARRRGALPEPIRVNDCTIMIWERQAVTPYLMAWGAILAARRRITSYRCIAASDVDAA